MTKLFIAKITIVFEAETEPGYAEDSLSETFRNLEYSGAIKDWGYTETSNMPELTDLNPETYREGDYLSIGYTPPKSKNGETEIK
jgi:hypothetical protein